jgi:hypothetical protein
MSEITITVDSSKPVVISAMIKDSTGIYITDTSMKILFGPSAHLQVIEKSVLACVEDICVPYSKKSSKGQVLEENGIWYLQLNSFCSSIGKTLLWTNLGKSVEITSSRK